MNKIGFIGMGNMAMALAAGFLETGRVQAENMCAFAPNQEKLRQNAQAVGFSACPSALAVVQKSDLVIMACKPYQIEGVLAEPGVREALAEKAMVSIAIGAAAGFFHPPAVYFAKYSGAGGGRRIPSGGPKQPDE